MALVARAKRELLLRVHRHRLRREDLEDCYSQATLELLARARRGARFNGRSHLAHTLEQRFLSRIHDRRRALSGRSPMQAVIEAAVPLDAVEPATVVDLRAELETLVILREDLRRVLALAHGLTSDQRLVMASQIGLQMGAGEFCRLYRWSPEKYRKVAQRGRARLKQLMALEARDVPTARAGRISRQGPAYEDISPHS